jgi:SNF2 family DNA or RNA helicase
MSSSSSSSWKLQQLKRKREFRQREEKRRQRLSEEQENDDDTLPSWRQTSPSKTKLKEAPPTRHDETPPAAAASKLKESPLSLLFRQTKKIVESKKKLSFGSPVTAAAAASIDKKWLDSPTSSTTTTRDVEVEAKSSSRFSSRKWLDSPEPKLEDRKPPAVEPAKKPNVKHSAAPPPPPPDDGASSSDDDIDLMAAFRKQKQQESSQSAAASQSSSPLQPSPKRRIGVEQKRKASQEDDTVEEFSPSQHDSLKEFSPSQEQQDSIVDDDDSSPAEENDRTRTKRLDKSLMEDSSEEEGNRVVRSRNHMPHNPLALVNQHKEQQQPVNGTSPPKIRSNAAEASLWSDSEHEEQEEEESSANQKKKKTKKKRKTSETSTAPQKKSKESSSSAWIGYDEDEDEASALEDANIRRLLTTNNRDTLEKTLHPIMDEPKFGPYALEPLILQGPNSKQRHEVPAALTRYLAPFQQEGIQFLYTCLTSNKTGAVLGDDMGCGKTVQTLGLLSALYSKTGTGLDLLKMDRRRKLVREKMQARRKEREEALLQGQVLAELAPDWIEDLHLPEWYPVLIVVPPTLMANWRNEFAKFTHFSVAFYEGPKREQALEQLKNGMAEVLVTSKALFMQKESFRALNQVYWKLVIIDEFHHYKVSQLKRRKIGGFLMIRSLLLVGHLLSCFFGCQNKDSYLSQHLRMLKSSHRSLVLGMTGTLMQNDHKELWNLIDLIETDYIGSWDEFKNEVADPIKVAR